jgi:hypothetical protein
VVSPLWSSLSTPALPSDLEFRLQSDAFCRIVFKIPVHLCIFQGLHYLDGLWQSFRVIEAKTGGLGSSVGRAED